MTEYTFKVTVIGDSSVGKTSLRRSFMGQSFKKNHMPTLGADFSVKKVDINGDNVELQIWDIAGQHDFSNLRNQFFSGTTASLVVFDLTNTSSFENMNLWIAHLFKNNRSGPVPLLIIGNKSDLNKDRVVTKTAIKKYVKELNSKYDFKVNYYETSAKTGENVDDAFLSFADQLVNLVPIN